MNGTLSWNQVTTFDEQTNITGTETITFLLCVHEKKTLPFISYLMLGQLIDVNHVYSVGS